MPIEKLNPVSVTFEDGFDGQEKISTYKCDVLVRLAGDSLWDCADTEVIITDIVDCENEVDGYRHISVAHSGSWRVYTDSAFKAVVRHLLGDDSIEYTEQGMQEDNFASME